MTFPAGARAEISRRGAATFLALLLLSGTLYFFRLGTPGLFDADEPAYAQAAREMLATGDWITPHFNGRPRFDKPILFYWLITLSYRVFGVTEFAVRFWSALAAVLLVLGIAWAGQRWFGPPAGLWAGLAFATSLLTALLARAAVTDMLLTLFVTAAILAGVEALEDLPGKGRWWARVSWVAMGLAVLVKGPVGLLVPGMALGGMLLVFREVPTGLPRLIPWEGPILFAAITLPWYALVWWANGWVFVEGFVVKHHISRYTGVVSSHAGPIWFYIPVALIGFFPWSGLLPQALWQAGAAAAAREARTPACRLLIACACWTAGVFVFFSFAGTKLPSYLFPAFPGMALLAGAAASSISNFKPIRLWRNNRSMSGDDRLFRLSERVRSPADRRIGCPFSIGPRGHPPRWVSRAGLWLIGVTGGALALGIGLIPRVLDAIRPLAGGVLDGVAAPSGVVWWLAGLFGLGTAGGLLARGPWRPAILSAMMSLVILTAGTMVAPRAYSILQGPQREFTEDARQILGSGGTLVVYGLNAPTIVFYANRPVIPIGAASADGLDQLSRLVEVGSSVVVITRIAHVSRLDGVPGLLRLKSRGDYAIYSSLRQADGGQFKISN